MLGFGSRNLAIFGGVCATVLAGVYVLYGPNEKKKTRKKDTCPGLVNLGNTCFLNAILQALAPCASVAEWLTSFLRRDSTKSTNKYLASTLHAVVKVLNNDSAEVTELEDCSPMEVFSALRAKRWVISHDEQDAHELFHILTESLEEEASYYPSVVSLFDMNTISDEEVTMYQPENVAANNIRSALPLLPPKDTDTPFRGLLASQLQCKQCAYKCPVKYDTFDSLSLSIPANFYGRLTVHELLKSFVSSEIVQNVECDGCAKQMRRKAKTTFGKKLTIGKLPQCLCLHIQRKVWKNDGTPLKRCEHVEFPEVLQMDDYVYHKQQMYSTMGQQLDGRPGLVGGRIRKNGFSKLNSKKTPLSNSTVTMPYSRPVNVLKALNYHSRGSVNGISTLPMIHEDDETPNHRDQVNSVRNNTQIQLLAQAYSAEALSTIRHHHSYKLAAVVVHLGDVFSGHFVTYRRVPSANGQRFPDRWLYTSDTLVRRASFQEVMSSDAYMLFYEKV